MLTSSTLILASLAALVAGHGNVIQPIARVVGSSTRANCGTAASNAMTSDITAPIENLAKVVDSGYNANACKLTFCRGAQFSDNSANVYTYAPGQKVDFKVNIRVRHTGVANVSIINTKTQTAIGTPLLNWPVYASTAIPASAYPKNETEFSITIPTTLGSACSTAGACTIQWYWFGSAQTYESCVDFVTPA